MDIAELQHFYASHAGAKGLLKVLGDRSLKTVFLQGLYGSSAPMLFSCLLNNSLSEKIFLFILNDLEEAGYFYHDLTQVCGDAQVLFFPSSFRRALKYGQKDAANEILRTEALSRIAASQKNNEQLLVVSYPDAIAEEVVSQDSLNQNTLNLKVGEKVDTGFVSEILENYHFQYTDYVYEPGQYATRGSLIDIFSFSSEYPYRIDFFGDEIESIRTFEVDTQLSKEKLNSVSIVSELNSVQHTVSLLNFIPGDTLLFIKDFLFVHERLDIIAKEGLSAQAQLVQNDQKIWFPKIINGYKFTEQATAFRRIEFGSQPTGNPQTTLKYNTTLQPVFHKNFDLVSESFNDYLQKKYTVYLLTDNLKQAERLKTIFKERGEERPFVAIEKTLHEGFVDNTLHCCFFTDHQLFDRFHKYNLKSDKARSGKIALTLKEINQFQLGDFVVHIDHGVGRFGGLQRIPSGNSTQEAVKIIYRNDDVVYVSIHNLHKISKYKGKEGEPPTINKLGTGAWERIKNRTKSKIKDIARDLIKLYSQRYQEKGFSFSPDSYLQHELEASFIYEDTPDQLKATQDIKADMEKSRPMDRLICGDVGFGKTEVAIRAAFKAVADNKQVAVLVPTTVLAYQHYQTFKDRLNDFPCNIEYLSRARQTKDVKLILEKLKNGSVDIIIGTHRLIGKDIKFKDLGLLIIDEEQKFGVAVKEKLKQLKVNVDTLTMTATPIPRTLQFSLMGARDLSIMHTPPPNRYPIHTEVHTFSPEVIKEAINFEMSRNGQVFFINNRISKLKELEELIHKYVPDARVCIGHGQMDPEELEKIIYDFVNYDYDVLLATSIVENGIDIPNVNTIIINQAHNFGLSDLHQMRGRVGRTNRRAFCYLLAPPLASLNQESRRRLEAIENFSDLGSGMQIALQDLDIRGAGNLLGAEQSGFIADLGYETYQKILAEAVRELKNEEFSDLFAQAEEEEQTPDKRQEQRIEDFVDECLIESDLELLFPNEYIPNSSERIALYRELDNLEQETEIENYRNRLTDRFGAIPKEGEELIRVVTLRRMAKEMGVEKIFLKGNRMTLFFVENPESAFYQSTLFGKIIEYLPFSAFNCQMRNHNNRCILVVQNVYTVETAIGFIDDFRQKMLKTSTKE